MKVCDWEWLKGNLCVWVLFFNHETMPESPEWPRGGDTLLEVLGHEAVLA